MRPAGLIALAAVLALEALATAALGVVVAAVALGTTAPVSGLAAGSTVLVTAVLLAAVAVGAYRARAWSRTATFVWQVVQLLVGLYAFQGAGAQGAGGNVAFGFGAVVPAVAALVLLLSRPVRDATRRR